MRLDAPRHPAIARAAVPLLAALLFAGCGERDAAPELRDPGSPDAAQQPATPASPTGSPPATPAGDPALQGGLPPGVTAQLVQEGHRIYHAEGICFTCHGADGGGSPLGPRLDDQEWIHITGDYEEIVQIIRAGVAQPRSYPGVMPPMGGANLSDAQLRAVAAYVFALSRGVGAITPP